MGNAALILIFATIVLTGLFVYATGRAATTLKLPAPERQRRRLQACSFSMLWLGAVGSLGASGWLSDFTSLPPHLLLFLVAVAVSAVLLSRSPLGKLLSAGLPFAALVGFQGFRILAELALWSAHKEGLAPVQMSFEGLNFDILSGISALVLAPWLARRPSRPVIWAWNFGALALLLVIVGIAVLSAPTPLRQFMNEPANTFVARFPYVLLPGVLVFAALLGHLLVFRKLRTPAN